MGVSAGQAVSDIITGIGRMSPLILDNLGIVGAAASMDRYAKSLGVASDQLTDEQKKQALVNAVIASSSGGSVVDDAAASFERMDASLANAKESLGVLFSPAISAIADKLADTVGRLTADMERGAKADAFANLGGLSETLQMGMADLQHWQDNLAVVQIGGDPTQISGVEAQIARVGAALADVGAQYNALRQSPERRYWTSGSCRMACLPSKNCPSPSHPVRRIRHRRRSAVGIHGGGPWPDRPDGAIGCHRCGHLQSRSRTADRHRHRHPVGA
ncbi:MAG: hypothetical protein IPM07_26315 [Anaerolineales bacterium]|nr:hypothetical protein [Anaerolineales bacterium]